VTTRSIYMGRFLRVILAGLPGVLGAFAGDGMPPRASCSDYPVYRQTGNAVIGAGLAPRDVIQKLLPPKVSKDFVVVEVGIFPLEEHTMEVDSFDFGLKFGGGEISHPRAPQEIVSFWMEEDAPQPSGKVGVTGEAGAVYTSGGDPSTGRSHGWGTYTGVGVGADPSKPPQPHSTDPGNFAAVLRDRALPEGPAVRPVAGYLYFPVPSKKRKSGPTELQHLKDGVLVSLPFPNK
jgi:hypothetical protein